MRDPEGTISHLKAAILERESLLRTREAALAQLQGRGSDHQNRVIYLGRDTLLVSLDFGRLVVPTWDMNVTVGVVRDGIIEPWTHGAVQALLRPGHTFVNVGANLGYYLVLGASAVGRTGRVIGIEANRRLFPYLMRTVGWSGYPDVIRLFNCAASDVDGQWIEFAFDPQHNGTMSVVSSSGDRDAQRAMSVESDRLADALWENADLAPIFSADGEWLNTTSHFLKARCETRRLDGLLAATEQAHLMLLDVEGSEPAAVLGAEDLIRRSPDLNLILEWSPFYVLREDAIAKTSAMYDMLTSLDYRFFRIQHENYSGEQGAPGLTRLPDKAALFACPHNDVLISKNPAHSVEGWSSRMVEAP